MEKLLELNPRPQESPSRGFSLPDSSLSVTLTVGQLRELIREELQSLLQSPVQGLLTADELADKLKVPVSWVYEQSRMGNIPTHRLGRYVRFNLQEVLASQKLH